MPPLQVFAAIIYVLRSGCPWKALPREFGSASAVHKHYQKWQRAGFFLDLWRAGLSEDEEMEGIAWSWRRADENMQKLPLAIERDGTHLKDEMGRRTQAKPVGKRIWSPAVARRQRDNAYERKLP